MGMTPRLSPTHMTYVKKHTDFRDFLANVHFRNVWTASTGQPDNSAAASDRPQNASENSSGLGLLACEKPKKMVRHTVMVRRDAHGHGRMPGKAPASSPATPVSGKRLFRKTPGAGFLGK